ncbi:MAG: alpha/beta fold hydrolase [Bacteroidales bacterium]|nr:alpha/beta fold hydrolase [Bacteroidales bacterium]
MDLYYREYGEGYPLIILHGLYGSSDNWISIAGELSDSYRVILPDLRNHGRSAHDPVHSYEAMSKDLYELATRLDTGKFILAGHSMGGKAAAYFARQWPEMLAGLVVIDISPFKEHPEQSISGSVHELILKKMTETNPSEIKNRKEADRLFREVSPSVKVRNFLLKNLHRNNKGVFEWRLNPEYLYDQLDNIYDGLDIPGTDETEPISGFPVFFLRAMESGYIREDDYKPIQRLFPAAEIIEVPGTSHWIHAEKPELIIKLIKENFPV